MVSNNIWVIIALIFVFIYNVLLLNYAKKILVKPSSSIFLLLLFALFNTFASWVSMQIHEHYYLGFFAVFTLISIEFKLISQASFRQATLGAMIFAFHIACVTLPFIMTFSYFFEAPPLNVLQDMRQHAIVLSSSTLFLIVSLILVDRTISHMDVMRVSTSTPYGEALLITTAFILSYLSFDAFCLISERFYIQQLTQTYAVTLLSLAVFYFLLLYTINFINLAIYKRQSDIVQSNYEQLQLKKKDLSDKLITDHLTKLYNKKYILEELENLVKTPDVSFGVLFLDINALKYVNDTYGHEIGDEYIKVLADSLKHSIRENDLPARISGDEFLALLPQVESEEQVKVVAQRVVEYIDKQSVRYDFKLSASLGYVYVSEELKHLGSLGIVELADSNMRNNKVHFYSTSEKSSGGSVKC